MRLHLSAAVLAAIRSGFSRPFGRACLIRFIFFFLEAYHEYPFP